jgi:hypothetical protein
MAYAKKGKENNVINVEGKSCCHLQLGSLAYSGRHS